MSTNKTTIIFSFHFHFFTAIIKASNADFVVPDGWGAPVAGMPATVPDAEFVVPDGWGAPVPDGLPASVPDGAEVVCALAKANRAAIKKQMEIFILTRKKE